MIAARAKTRPQMMFGTCRDAKSKFHELKSSSHSSCNVCALHSNPDLTKSRSITRSRSAEHYTRLRAKGSPVQEASRTLRVKSPLCPAAGPLGLASHPAGSPSPKPGTRLCHRAPRQRSPRSPSLRGRGPGAGALSASCLPVRHWAFQHRKAQPYLAHTDHLMHDYR